MTVVLCLRNEQALSTLELLSPDVILSSLHWVHLRNNCLIQRATQQVSRDERLLLESESLSEFAIMEGCLNGGFQAGVTLAGIV